jgi:hypothetical protein
MLKSAEADPALFGSMPPVAIAESGVSLRREPNGQLRSHSPDY